MPPSLRASGLSLLLLACREPVPVPSPPIELEVHGATAIEAGASGRVYWFDAPRAPRLRVIGSDEQLAFRWENGPARIARRAGAREDGAVLIDLERPNEGKHRLEVLRGDRSIRQIAIVTRSAASEEPRVRRIAELATGDPTAAEAALDELPPALWPWGCVEVARRAPVDARPDAYLRCARGAEARGFVSEGASRRIAAVFWARQLRQLHRAGLIAEEAARAVRAVGDARLEAQLAHQEAQLARELSDLRAAQAKLLRALELAERIGEQGEAILYGMEMASVLSELGRHDEAAARARALLTRDSGGLRSQDAASLSADGGWILLRAATDSGDRGLLEEARAALVEAKRRYLELSSPAQAANVVASLALLELRAEDPASAERAIAEARRLNPARGVETPFLDLLEGELHLASGAHLAARAAFARVVDAAAFEAPRASTDYLWRARLGLAQVDLAQGRSTAAQRSLAEARAILARNARRSGERTAEISFLDDRRRLYATAVASLLDEGDIEAAWRVADEAQALLFRALEGDRGVRLSRLAPDARDRWEREEAAYVDARTRFLSETVPELASRSALRRWRADRRDAARALAARRDALYAALDALDTPPPLLLLDREMLAKDEALLELFSDGTHARAFWVTRERVETFELDLEPLLTPARASDLAHLYLVTGGAKGGSRLGSRVADGRPLIAWASVSELPYAGWLLRKPRPAAGRPLVVADPRRDLRHARAEGVAVAALLGAELVTGDDAELATVLAQLDGARVFHFAGHGRLSAEAPWGAHLELARGQVLDFELLLARRPRVGLAVLSGCETGRPARAPVDGVGLPEAFLAAGADAVLATDAVVVDADARRFIERFYRNRGADRPADAFRRAALESEREGDSSWRAFRLLGRRRSGVPHHLER